MRSTRFALLAAAASIAVIVGGCGVGAGSGEEGVADLVVTRDHGAQRLLEATVQDPVEAETVVRFLDREAEIETSFAGNFVDSIEGLAGDASGGRTRDWFFFVNGYWSPVGAGEAQVRAGDRIWWDYRDWSDAYRVPAVVGSFPEPFLHGRDGTTPNVTVVCLDAGPACGRALARLADAGIAAERVGRLGTAEPGAGLRVLVGPWGRVRSDPIAALLERGPGISGVYVKPQRCGERWQFDLLDDHGETKQSLAEAGLVAALQKGDEEPTWVVTGTGPGSLGTAAGSLEREALADRYALALSPGANSHAAPVPDGADAIGSRGCP